MKNGERTLIWGSNGYNRTRVFAFIVRRGKVICLGE